MSNAGKTEKELVQALEGLGRNRPPARDLWPDIAARLDDQQAGRLPARPSWRMPAIAASLALAFVVGMLMGRQTTEQGTGGVDEMGQLAARVMAGALQESELEYQAAFRSLTPVDVVPSVFEAGDIAAIEASWYELHQAETALLAALREHPDNQFLGEKLLDLRAQQLEFMKQLRMLDENSRRNI